MTQLLLPARPLRILRAKIFVPLFNRGYMPSTCFSSATAVLLEGVQRMNGTFEFGYQYQTKSARAQFLSGGPNPVPRLYPADRHVGSEVPKLCMELLLDARWHLSQVLPRSSAPHNVPR